MPVFSTTMTTSAELVSASPRHPAVRFASGGSETPKPPAEPMDQFSTPHKLMLNSFTGVSRALSAVDMANTLTPGDAVNADGSARQRLKSSTSDRNESMVIVLYTGGTIGMKATRRDDCDGTVTPGYLLYSTQWRPTRPCPITCRKHCASSRT